MGRLTTEAFWQKSREIPGVNVRADSIPEPYKYCYIEWNAVGAISAKRRIRDMASARLRKNDLTYFQVCVTPLRQDNEGVSPRSVIRLAARPAVL